jgi:hypothetical protein
VPDQHDPLLTNLVQEIAVTSALLKIQFNSVLTRKICRIECFTLVQIFDILKKSSHGRKLSCFSTELII